MPPELTALKEIPQVLSWRRVSWLQRRMSMAGSLYSLKGIILFFSESTVRITHSSLYDVRDQE
jgi:hypothetical protein